MAETVWSEGLLIEEFPPEAYHIKCIEDSWAHLATEDGQRRQIDNSWITAFDFISTDLRTVSVSG